MNFAPSIIGQSQGELLQFPGDFVAFFHLSMKRDGIEEVKQTLEDLLETIIHKESIDQMINLHKFCLFFNDILSYSRIGQRIDAFLWAIFFLLINFTIFMQSLPLTFFTGLNYHLSNFDYTSTMFLSIRITFQQISIFFSVILIFAILYQWFNFFSYNPNKHLSRKNATLLHFSVMYFPLIALPILGYIFGLNIVCNSDSRFVTELLFEILIIFKKRIFLLLDTTF